MLKDGEKPDKLGTPLNTSLNFKMELLLNLVYLSHTSYNTPRMLVKSSANNVKILKQLHKRPRKIKQGMENVSPKADIRGWLHNVKVTFSCDERILTSFILKSSSHFAICSFSVVILHWMLFPERVSYRLTFGRIWYWLSLRQLRLNVTVFM